MTAQELRGGLVGTLQHIREALNKVRQNAGIHQTFNFPDAHKLSEGLYLSAWTQWEEFIRELLVIDLATTTGSFLLRDVRDFRVKGAPLRYAERLLSHRDADRGIEWSYARVFSRAEALLPAGHRFPKNLQRNADLKKLKVVRNAIAHRSDSAWVAFVDMVRKAPFNLSPNQMRGITVGRFIFSHQWNGQFILEEALDVINDSCFELVP